MIDWGIQPCKEEKGNNHLTQISTMQQQHYLDVCVEEPLEEALVGLPLHRPHGPAAGAVLTSHPPSLRRGHKWDCNSLLVSK